MLRTALAALCAIAASAHADGFYYEESGGIAVTHGSAGAYLGNTMYLRLGVGVRLGAFSIEPWMAGNLDTSREGAQLALFGGDPKQADLESYGIDLKYAHDLVPHAQLYVRGGPLRSSGTGSLDGYSGFGFGGAAGIQVVGQVRALGFLFLPLFFTKRGPLVTGALFFDEGLQVARLSADRMPALDARTTHATIGFAIGSAF